ncbi:MAG: PilZ domain-containing protein [Magnetococcales bacterium]|nr:PilZ domain-containing protein [Magnetococcales bacterium]
MDKRIRFVTGLSLSMDTGLAMEGQTTDVSLSGAFMQIEGGPPEEIQSGDRGVVGVMVKEEENTYTMSFPCTVVRVTHEGLGLDFDEEISEEEVVEEEEEGNFGGMAGDIDPEALIRDYETRDPEADDEE